MTIKIIHRIIVPVLIITAIILNFHGIIHSTEQEETTIVGEIVAMAWDDDDNVLEVAISVRVEPDDPDEDIYYEEYLIANNDKGNELLAKVGSKVKATGIVQANEDGSKLITISKYIIINDEE